MASDNTDTNGNDNSNNLVTADGQIRVLEEIQQVYKDLNVGLQCEQKPVPAHDLIATQDGIEQEKFETVKQMVRAGKLDIPIIVEEHFVDGDYKRYVLDGHCRTRAHIEQGKRYVDAYVLWSEAGDFPSNFVSVAEQYGNVRVKDLQMV
ncbi:MAG: ParB/RepB/Spo0J family partition protein [Armatimonadota bacterium]